MTLRGPAGRVGLARFARRTDFNLPPMPVRWEGHGRIPPPVKGILAALRLNEPGPLGFLEQREAGTLLEFCDRNQLTGLLSRLPGLPPWLREAVERRLEANQKRLARIQPEIFEICERLERESIPYLMLKGLAQQHACLPHSRYRVQYDLDLYCPQACVTQAWEAIRRAGYSPLAARPGGPTDHLVPLIRKTAWQWRGDYFDPEIPLSVELHFRFWDEATEGFPAPGTESFWERRTRRQIAGRSIPVLHPADALAYSALHVLRHLLRGSLRVCHVWELAYQLDAEASNDTFWQEWARWHPRGLQQLEAISFRLAWAWFACRLSPVAEEAIRRLPAAVGHWFKRYAASPVENFFHPNKDELALHVALLEGSSEQRRIVLRRLFPRRLPAGPTTAHMPEAEVTAAVRWRTRLSYAHEVWHRAWRHLRTFPRAVWCVLEALRVARPGGQPAASRTRRAQRKAP